jgi:hypothetical protein
MRRASRLFMRHVQSDRQVVKCFGIGDL